jgi:hypothetical protein
MKNTQISGFKSERGPFLWLLVTQVIFMATSPRATDFQEGRWVRLIGLFAILIAGVYAAAVRRGFLVISVALLVPAIFAWLGPDVFSGNIDEASRLLSAAACFAFTVGIVTSAVARHKEVRQETILGSIDAYLLIGLTFMLLHQAVAIADPSAYTLNGKGLNELTAGTENLHGLSTMLYFSFTTLTTLGYGDVAPHTPIARLLTSTEAIIGQLYVAIFIARLVSIQVSQRIMHSNQSD